MSEVRVDNLSNENLGGPTLSGITTYSSKHFFVPPVGDTGSRPQSCPSGSLRFNTDSKHLEYYRGDTIGWVDVEAELTEPLGGGTGSNTGLGTRGLIMGGQNPGIEDIIDFVTVSTLGNAQDFGNLTAAHARGSAVGSRVRGVRAGGQDGSNTINIIESVTFATTGNASNFGDLNNKPKFPAPMSNGVRGLFAGGYTPSNIDVIDYITIAEDGNAVDFGNLSFARNRVSGCSSSTRGLILGGAVPSPSPFDEGGNMIDFITIATLGDGQDFGDLSTSKFQNVSVSNATRAIIFGGRTQPNGDNNNVIDFITIASLGNATDFGDDNGENGQAGVSSPTRAVRLGARTSPADTNSIIYVAIATQGNAVDFGDLLTACNNHSTGGASNAHGGLG